MTTDYNQGNMPELFKQAKQQPWRSRVESHTFLKVIGDVTGKKVVDFACGEGYYTRKLKQAGAAHVTGVDISEEMIKLARAQEERDPVGVDYRVEDARTMVAQQDYDLSVSAWLLVYAHDRAELNQMCLGLGRWLKPGGRLVTLMCNPQLYFYKPSPEYRKYGFTMKLADKVSEGAPILWTSFVEGGSINIENYYLPLEATESAFQQAGFRDFKVHQLELGPNPDGTDDCDFWADFLKWPIAVLVDCIKS